MLHPPHYAKFLHLYCWQLMQIITQYYIWHILDHTVSFLFPVIHSLKTCSLIILNSQKQVWSSQSHRLANVTWSGVYIFLMLVGNLSAGCRADLELPLIGLTSVHPCSVSRLCVALKQYHARIDGCRYTTLRENHMNPHVLFSFASWDSYMYSQEAFSLSHPQFPKKQFFAGFV